MGMSHNEFMKTYKKIRENAFNAEVRASQREEDIKKKTAADMEYLSMMTGVDMSQDDDDEEEQEETE